MGDLSEHGPVWPICSLDQTPVPLSIFWSNSKFNENSKHSSVKYMRPITTIFCTRHDSVTVVQNIVVIGGVYSKLERSEFSSNFEFDRNMLNGTGARFASGIHVTPFTPMNDIFFVMWPVEALSHLEQCFGHAEMATRGTVVQRLQNALTDLRGSHHLQYRSRTTIPVPRGCHSQHRMPLSILSVSHWE